MTRLLTGCLISLILCATTGCATIGPQVTSQEIQAARLELAIKGLRRTAEQQQRVWKIGHQLLVSLPPEEQQTSYPDIGVGLAKIDKTSRTAFHLPDSIKRGVYVLSVREGSPAQTGGLMQGDVVLAIRKSPCSSIASCISVLGKAKPGEELTFRIDRAGTPMEMAIVVGSRPRKIDFWVTSDQIVNAWTDDQNIVVTGGMLRFLESDDELAVVLGHELAHVTGHHRGKETATGVLSTLLGATLGIAAEIAAPGTGDAIMNATSGLTQSAFMRNFEREADYKGLLHTFRAGYDASAGVNVWERMGTDIPESLTQDLRSSHPASPERMVRIRKVAQALAAEGLEATIAKYETQEAKTSDSTQELSTGVAETPPSVESASGFAQSAPQ